MLYCMDCDAQRTRASAAACHARTVGARVPEDGTQSAASASYAATRTSERTCDTVFAKKQPTDDTPRTRMWPTRETCGACRDWMHAIRSEAAAAARAEAPLVAIQHARAA